MNNKFVLTHGIWKNKEHTSSSEVTFHNSYDDAIRKLPTAKAGGLYP